MNALKLLPALVLFTTSLIADDTTKVAKVERLLELSHVDRLIEQSKAQMAPVFDQMLAQNSKQLGDEQLASEIKQEAMAFFDQQFNWRLLKPDMVQIYAETFSDEELDAIVRFYETPAGQSMIEKMPVLMAKSMALVQNRVQAAIPDLQARIKERLEKRTDQQK